MTDAKEVLAHLADKNEIAPNNRYHEQGVKDDAGKPPMDLVPWDSVMGAARVFGFGATKYGDWNWTRLSKTRLLAAALRHTIAYLWGEDNDPETGELHVYHAVCCLLMVGSSAHEGKDDRWIRRRRPKDLVTTITSIEDASPIRIVEMGDVIESGETVEIKSERRILLDDSDTPGRIIGDEHGLRSLDDVTMEEWTEASGKHYAVGQGVCGWKGCTHGAGCVPICHEGRTG